MATPPQVPGSAIRTVRNPEAHTPLSVSAGGVFQIEIGYDNISPDVANFHLEQKGLPAAWAEGTGAENGTLATPGSQGLLALRLRPESNAPPGEYEFQVQLYASETILMKEIPLLLRLVPSVTKIDSAPATYAVVGGRQPATPLQTPTPASTPPPNATAPVSSTTGSGTGTTQDDLSDWQAEHLETVTLDPDANPDDPDIAAEQSDEVTFTDPKEGQIFRVYPGNRCLVRFTFENTASRESTYILDEDRSLDAGWMELVQDEVNLSRNANGELSLRLTPPENARPGEYSFEVMFGLQGTPPTRRRFTLVVPPTPAVRIVASPGKITINPFNRIATFALTIESIGNADTAFRLAIGQGDATDAKSVVMNPLYESRRWTYHFDREAGDLIAPTPDQPPRPVRVSLQVRPTGAWLDFGQKRHQFTVVATPVTDPTNGDKPGNAAQLTVRRSLPAPVPGAIFYVVVPVMLLILLCCSFFIFLPTELAPIDPAPLYKNNPIAGTKVAQSYYVKFKKGSRQPDNAIIMHWQTHWFSIPDFAVKLTGGNLNDTNSKDFYKHIDLGKQFFGKDATIAIPENVLENGTNFEFNASLTRVLGPGEIENYVKVIFVDDNHNIVLYSKYKSNINLDFAGAEDKPVDITVPSNFKTGVVLRLRNMSSAFYRVRYWVVKRPTPRAMFRLTDNNTSGTIEPCLKNQEILQDKKNLQEDEKRLQDLIKSAEQPQDIKFVVQYNAAGSTNEDDNTLVILTSDPRHTKIQIHFAIEETPGLR